MLRRTFCQSAAAAAVLATFRSQLSFAKGISVSDDPLLAPWTGPHGGTYEGGGKCANGTCQSSGTFTGPYGGVWRHSGNAHQVAPGQWSGEGQVSGPAGGTLQHSWSWHRAGI